MILKDEIAADLRDNIDATSHVLSPDKIATVWVDYGKLAKMIRVRARTEIQCSLKSNYCTIDDNVIAFIPYDEHHPCGYLSESENNRNLLF